METVTLQEIKTHLRLDSDNNTFDLELIQLKLTAINEVESYINQHLNETSFPTGLPASIKHAILLKIGEYYDQDRSGYVIGSMKESKAFDRLLTPHIKY